MFTGNLEKKVVSNPHFNGLEKNLLRAQIARISQSTQLVTTGIYKVNEDDSK
jgi:radial spoke head protein 4/6